MGEAVRYDGGNCLSCMDSRNIKRLQTWQAQGLFITVCPEVAGGLSVPRPAAEIRNHQVVTQAGFDVTSSFVRGAEKALSLCQKHHIKYAVLKQGSPSCGNSLINDGSFHKIKIQGSGITASLLTQHGIQVFNESELHILEALL